MEEAGSIPLAGATGGCHWRVPLVGATGGCHWRVPLAACPPV